MIGVIGALLACTSGSDDRTDPTTSLEGPFPVALEGLGVHEAPDGLVYEVRRAPVRLPGAWDPPPAAWTGRLTLDAPGPEAPVVTEARVSGGPVPFPSPAASIALGAARATVLTTMSNRLLGLEVAQEGALGTMMDLDGDGVVDVVEALRITPGQVDPVERIVALSPLGLEHRTRLAEGMPGLCTGGPTEGYPDEVRIAVSCEGTLRRSSVEVLRVGRDAVDALDGLGRPPSAEQRSRLAQLQTD
ncbi:MAG: hypothetical protein AAF602_31350, partial [Myxococcota bacterium]